MKNLKVLFTLIALGFGYAGFAQEVTIINKTDCDFDYVLSQSYLTAGCVPYGPTPSGTVASSSTATVFPSLDEFIYVELTESLCNTGVALVPDISLDCSTCTAYPSINSSETILCDQCGDDITMKWVVDCQAGTSIIYIEY